MRIAELLLSCGLLIGIAASPALAQSPEPAFRGTEAEQQASGAAPSAALGQAAGVSPMHLPMPTRLAANESPRLQLAQAGPAPAAPAAPAGNPWVVGTTV